MCDRNLRCSYRIHCRQPGCNPPSNIAARQGCISHAKMLHCCEEEVGSKKGERTTNMKRIAISVCAALCLLLGIPSYAQEQKEEPQAPQQEEKAKPEKQQNEEKPAKEEHSKQEERQPAKHGEARPDAEKTQNGGNAKPADQRHDQNGAQARSARAAGKGGHIPDDKFRSHFGRQHTFVVNRPVIVQNTPRFQQGGFWFEIVDPWPAAWAYTDECYIDYIDGEYFLFDLLHPSERIVVIVVL